VDERRAHAEAQGRRVRREEFLTTNGTNDTNPSFDIFSLSKEFFFAIYAFLDHRKEFKQVRDGFSGLS